MSRQPRFRPDDLDPPRRALYDAIAHGPRNRGRQGFALTDADGVLRGPFNAFLLSPAVGDALQQVGAAVRYRTGLGARTRELAILMVAAHHASAFERDAHEPIGRTAGVTEEEIAVVRAGDVPAVDDPHERACLTVTRALLAGDIDDATWSACVPPLDEPTVFELCTLVGYYSTLALQMRIFRV